jgi:hypothetical protein
MANIFGTLKFGAFNMDGINNIINIVVLYIYMQLSNMCTEIFIVKHLNL